MTPAFYAPEDEKIVPVKLLQDCYRETMTLSTSSLERMLKFKPYYERYKADGGRVSRLYELGAKATLMSKSGFRDRMLQVSRYEDADMREWFAKGIGWNHLKHAPSLRPDAPAELLIECIDIGGKNGDTMTVDEMITYELGTKQGRDIEVRIERAIQYSAERFCKLLKFTERQTSAFKSGLFRLLAEVKRM